MTPRERLHELLVDVMNALGHAPAVFIGQDQRNNLDQVAPVIVYSAADSEVVETLDGSVPLREVWELQISSRTATAPSDIEGITEMIRSRVRMSDEADVQKVAGDRDDDLEMIYTILEISIDSGSAETPIHHPAHAGTRIVYGPPSARKRIAYHRKTVVW